jgi:hypothetical protein
VSRKNSSACGARTRACRVHTRVNAFAPSRVCTRPRIVFDSRNQSSLHRIPLNVSGDLAPLGFISNPMVVRLALPKLLTRAMKQPISLPSRDALERFQQHAGRNRRQQRQVDVIGHDDERPEDDTVPNFDREAATRLPAWLSSPYEDRPGQRALRPDTDLPMGRPPHRRAFGQVENESSAGCRADAR